MRAAVYEKFTGPLSVQTVPDPEPPQAGAVIQVQASGVCRSDWHGWMGHDSDIKLPHVPGHEFAGIIAALGKNVSHWKVGDRVTMPFFCACGACLQCVSGNHQMCDHQYQPGFRHWGSYAEYVAIDHADTNLVAVPESMDVVTAAGLGCRFATAFRAVVMQGTVGAGQWVAIHGCGGVGLSAIMIAEALGANTIAVDVTAEKLAFASSLGASSTVNGVTANDVPAAIQEITGGGAHVSIDALGSATTCLNSIECLRKHGKHIQVGLMAGDDAMPGIPMGLVIFKELEILGSHGMQAHKYVEMLTMIESGKLHPERLIGRTISLEESTSVLANMNTFAETGVAIINQF